MKATLTLAAAIAATLVLAACSHPPASTVAVEAKHAEPAIAPNGSEAGHIAVNSATPNGASRETVTSPTFTASRLSRLASAKGAYSVDALFHADGFGTLRVGGENGEVVFDVSAKKPVNNNDYTFPERLRDPLPLLLTPGWYRLAIVCTSDRCDGVNATFDGKPIVPFAVSFGVVAARQ